MPRARWYLYLIIFLISMILAVYFGYNSGNLFEPPGTNWFFTIMLVGAWIMFIIKLSSSAAYLRSFNSMQNHALFVFGTNLAALIFSAWGNFTTLLAGPLMDSPVPWIQINLWSLVFSFPLSIFGTFQVFACFRRYFYVYIGEKSVNSKKFGVFVVVFSIIFEAMYLAFIFFWFGSIDVPLGLLSRHVDPLALLLLLVALAITIRYGRTPSIPDITTPLPEPPRPRPAPRSYPTPRPVATPAPRPAIRATTRPGTTRSAPAPEMRPMAPRVVQPATVRVNIDELRPKGSVLSREDFKCIFCFNLPKSPEDDQRGIVVCPSCRHPAHADEFKEWARSSGLCSRCDGKLPESFRKKPKIVSVKVYLDAMKRLASQIKG